MTRKYEEQIGVCLPNHGRFMVTVLVTGLESDEEILQRISTTVGTIFNVTGVKYEVVSSDPFRLKKLSDMNEEAEGETAIAELPTEPEEAAPIAELPRPKPESVPPPESERRVSHPGGPLIGERWKPKDPRRKASFTVMAIEGDHVVTDDGRKIQLARFNRYERVDQQVFEPAFKVS